MLNDNKNVKTVSIRISRPASEILERITAATEREILPFISASRYPQHRKKEFVSRIRGNRFRIWKLPSSSRSRQNICIPCLQGVVESVEDGSLLTGTFFPHPFLIWVFLPWIILVSILLWAPKDPGTLLWQFVLPIIFLIFNIVVVRALIRLLPKEQQDIIQFLLTLFSEKQPGLEAESG
jgi:hypothetical protein